MFNLYPSKKPIAFAIRLFLPIFIISLFSLSLNAQPKISSFSPAAGPIGTTVTITGANYNSNKSGNIVYFGAAKATVLAATPSTLVVTVPVGATYQPITVTTNGLTAFSLNPFNVTAPAPFNSFTSSTFSYPPNLITGAYPNFITGADLDSDGKTDLIALNNNSSTLSVYRNNGGYGMVSFTTPIDFAAGTHPAGAAVGDLNGDGQPDIVVGDYDSSRIIIYKNSGGNLSQKQTYLSGLNPLSIGIIDFDLDGKPDVAAVNNNDHTVSIFQNISISDSILFAPKKDFPVGNWPQRLAIKDFDGDGKPDIAVPNYNDNTVSVLKNTSTGSLISFASKIDFQTGNSPFHVSASDINGDGKPEMVVSNSSAGSISVFKNNSTNNSINFSTKLDLLTGNSPVFSTLADMDGNGKPEIAVVNFSGNSISIFNNNSITDSIILNPKADYPTDASPRAVSIGDLDGDGQPDISVVNSNSNTIQILKNTMRAVPIIQSFSPRTSTKDSIISIYGSGFSITTQVVLGGTPVISYTNSPTFITAKIGSGSTGDIVVTTNEGNAVISGFTFSTPPPVIKSFSPENGQVGTEVTIRGNNFKFNNGSPIVYFGAVKAIVSNATDSILSVTVPAGSTFSPITVTVNSLTAYSANSFKPTFPASQKGFKTSSFKSSKDFIHEGSPRNIAVADFDGDGKPDLLITNQSTGTVSIYKNSSTLSNVLLGAKQDFSIEEGPFGCATGDFDGDGKIDLAISNLNNGDSGYVTIKRNITQNGNISFSDNIKMAVGQGTMGIKIRDLNADGKPDLIVAAGNSAIISVFKNTSDSIGSISFGGRTNITALYHSQEITISDIDGDMLPEIISADFGSNSMTVWRNTSTTNLIAFSTGKKFAAGGNPVGIGAADFDNDGKTDVAVANYTTNNISVLKNTSTVGFISFESKIDYQTGEFPRSISVGDLNGDGKIDIVVPCNNPSGVYVLKNITTSNTLLFENAFAYNTGVEPVYTAVADLNGDHKPEMIVPNRYSLLSIFQNRFDVPIISSFTPTTAKTDTVITIKGENLNETTNVLFGNIPASSFTIVSDSIIHAKVGKGATGTVRIVTPYGSDTLGTFTYIPPAPAINSFIPESGTVGTEIIIAGKNLNTVISVKIGGINAASYTIITDTLIRAIVGKGASGNIIISNKDESDTIGIFNFIPPVPMISTFTPTSGTTGTLVNLKGKNFTWTSDVTFGSTKASYMVSSDSTITAVVPEGGSGIIRITNEFGKDTLGTFILLQEDAMVAYPNPAEGTAVLAHPTTVNTSQIKLVDINGRVVKTFDIPKNEEQTKIDLKNVPPGIYKIVWVGDNKNTLSHTIMVK